MDRVLRLTKDQFNKLIYEGKVIGTPSSTSIVYELKNGLILKDLKDESIKEYVSEENMNYSEEQLLKFSNIDSKLYYFIKGVIYVDNELEAGIMKKCNGHLLTMIDPLSININLFTKAIDRFNKATIDISKKHIKGFDMKYNFMYDGYNFGAIDTNEYDFSNLREDEIYKSNIGYFNSEIAEFLVDFYFKKFVNQTKELNDMYNSLIGLELINVNEFIILLRKKLSEYCDKKIVYLQDAKMIAEENENLIYPLCPIYKLNKNSKKQSF